MTVVWRADDQPPPARLEYMRHAIADSIVPFELRPEHDSRFRCEIRAADVGGLRFVDIAAPASEAVRGAPLIRRSDPELCTIHLQVRGHPVVEQGDRQVRVPAGDLTFVDLSRPTRVAGPAHRQVSVMFPRVLLPLRGDEVEELAGLRLSGRHGTGALVAGLIRQIAGDPDQYGGPGAARVGTALLDLITATLTACAGRDVSAPPQHRQVLMLRIEAFIDQQLADPSLSPGTIAAAHHVSVRYLHRLFEPHATTVAGLIRERRLQRCRRDLTDPAHGHVPVGAIGARWGFTDPAQFSRVFRAEYGIPPGRYRGLHLSNGAGSATPGVPASASGHADAVPDRPPAGARAGRAGHSEN